MIRIVSLFLFFTVLPTYSARNATFGEFCEFFPTSNATTCDTTKDLACYWDRTCRCKISQLKWSSVAQDCLPLEGSDCTLQTNANQIDLLIPPLLLDGNESYQNALLPLEPNLYYPVPITCDRKLKCVKTLDSKEEKGICCHPQLINNCTRAKITESFSDYDFLKLQPELGSPCNFSEYSRVAESQNTKEYNRLVQMNSSYPQVICGDFKNTNLECQEDNRCHCRPLLVIPTGDLISNFGFCIQSFEELAGSCYLEENSCCPTSVDTSFVNTATFIQYSCSPMDVCVGNGLYGRCVRRSSHEAKERSRHLMSFMAVPIDDETIQIFDEDKELEKKTQKHHRMLLSRSYKVKGQIGFYFMAFWLHLFRF